MEHLPSTSKFWLTISGACGFASTLLEWLPQSAMLARSGMLTNHTTKVIACSAMPDSAASVARGASASLQSVENNAAEQDLLDESPATGHEHSRFRLSHKPRSFQ